MSEDHSEIRQYEVRMMNRKYDRELQVFRDAGIEFKEQGNRTLKVRVEGRDFIFTTTNGRWRQCGKSTWYRSRGSASFLDKVTKGRIVPPQESRHRAPLEKACEFLTLKGFRVIMSTPSFALARRWMVMGNEVDIDLSDDELIKYARSLGMEEE